MDMWASPAAGKQLDECENWMFLALLMWISGMKERVVYASRSYVNQIHFC